jgi:hypothetical protein
MVLERPACSPDIDLDQTFLRVVFHAMAECRAFGAYGRHHRVPPFLTTKVHEEKMQFTSCGIRLKEKTIVVPSRRSRIRKTYFSRFATRPRGVATLSKSCNNALNEPGNH